MTTLVIGWFGQTFFSSLGSLLGIVCFFLGWRLAAALRAARRRRELREYVARQREEDRLREERARLARRDLWLNA